MGCTRLQSSPFVEEEAVVDTVVVVVDLWAVKVVVELAAVHEQVKKAVAKG